MVRFQLRLPLAVMLAALPLLAVAEPQYSVPVERSSTRGTSSSQSSNSSQSTNNAYSLPSAQTSGKADAMWEIYNQIEVLQEEVRQLRGIVETQRNEIDLMRNQQRERYLDLDRRLNMMGDKVAQGGQGSLASESDDGDPKGVGKAGEREAYKAAQALVKEKKLKEAEQAFADFLKKYPDGDFAAHSQYWIGLVQMALPEPKYAEAKKHFEILLKRYPKHVKVPATLYKLGTLLDLQGDTAGARKQLEKVVSEYKGTAAAELAERYLESLSSR